VASAILNTAGLGLSLIGVLLLFRYGMPYRVRTPVEGPAIRVGERDSTDTLLEARYGKLGWMGLILIVIGTALQMIGIWT